jgi:2C-methyl-D-erythritol 2,4-cyclodiphosphate synthase
LANTSRPNDPTITGIDSLLIVKKCLGMVKEKGYRVNNCRCLDLPPKNLKLAPFIEEMKANLALALEIKESKLRSKR